MNLFALLASAALFSFLYEIFHYLLCLSNQYALMIVHLQKDSKRNALPELLFKPSFDAFPILIFLISFFFKFSLFQKKSHFQFISDSLV